MKNIPEKWIAISTTEFREICTDPDCDDKSLRICEFMGEGESWNNRCYTFVPDYPDVQYCNKEQALIYAMTGLEVRPAEGDRL
jgi:hypothetical protein